MTQISLDTLSLRIESQADTQEKCERVLGIMMEDPAFPQALRAHNGTNIYINIARLQPATIQRLLDTDLQNPPPPTSSCTHSPPPRQLSTPHPYTGAVCCCTAPRGDVRVVAYGGGRSRHNTNQTQPSPAC